MTELMDFYESNFYRTHETECKFCAIEDGNSSSTGSIGIIEGGFLQLKSINIQNFRNRNRTGRDKSLENARNMTL